MKKTTFLENIGGFLITPKTHTLSILTEKEQNWKSIVIQSIVFVLVSSVFAGCVLMFYMMYPEVFWVPGAAHTGRMFVYAAASPIFIIGMFGLGFILVFLYEFIIHGSISYLLVKTTVKRNEITHSLSYGKYMSLFSYSHIYTTLFYMITVLWIYFFEKFTYTKIFFPVTDLTLPVIIHLIILSIMVILKWIWEIRMNLGVITWSESSKSDKTKFIVIWMVIRVVFTIVLVIVVYFSGNLIAGAQWS